MSGSTAATGALTTSGGSNGAGGNVSVTGASGGVTIGGAITASGGNSLAAAIAGGNAGTITLDAGGATPTITLAGNLSATGGNKSGAGTDGAGAKIQLMDAVLLNAATVTISALGGSAGAGPGGDVLFDKQVDSTGGARSLVVNTNGNTVFTGAVGASSALQALTTDAPGTTKINGGTVTTVGTQTYNDALVLGAATQLNTTNSAISATGAVTATAGALTLATGTGDISMNHADNDFGAVVVTSGNNVTFNDKNALTAGPVTAAGNVLLQTASGAGNDLTLAGNITSTGGGITLASGEDIHYGTSALSAATRWLTYSVDPANDTGTIPTPGNAKPNIYNSTFAALGPGVVLPGTGNHHVYSIQPTLTYTADAAARTYGAANPAFTGTVNGLVNGDTAADAYSGTLSFTSTATNASNVGSYDLNGSGLTSDVGYKFVQAPANATALTINPATLTYTANAANRLYGAADPAFSGTVSGFVLGETQGTATTGALSFTTPAVANSNVGTYALNGSSLAANNGNYVFVQAPANATALTINPATLTYTANAANRLYGAADPAFSGTVTGFVLGETQGTATTGALGFTTPAVANSNVGNYAINGSGLAANNGNYVFVQAPANATAFTINPAIINLAGSRTYDSANTFAGATFGAAGTINTGIGGQTLQVVGGPGTVASANVAAGSQALTLGGLTLSDGTGLASNYTLTGGTHTGTVSAKTVNLAGSRVYDGTTNFNAGGFTPAITGTVGAETLTLASGSGTVASANVAAGMQTLTTATLVLGDGSGLASNYTLAGGTHTGMITAKALTAAIVGTPTKVYDGNTNAILGPANFNLTGFVGTESATVTQTAGVYNSKDVLTANNARGPGRRRLLCGRRHAPGQLHPADFRQRRSGDHAGGSDR